MGQTTRVGALTRQLFSPAEASRIFRLGLFRLHVENGLSVAVGLAIVGAGFGLVFGFASAIVATTGALCVSIVDQPDPLRQKPWILASAVLPTALATLAAALGKGMPWSLCLAAGLVGLWTGLISIYGKRALGLGMATVLAFVFGLGADQSSLGGVLVHQALFVGGAVAYAVYAGLAALVFDGRVRRLLLAEAMRALARYMRAKAALYNLKTPASQAFRSLIEAHTDLVERLQTARDGLFLYWRDKAHLRQIEILISLLDAFEVLLAGDADVETLRGSAHHHLMRRMGGVVEAMADEIEAMTLAVSERRPCPRPADHASARSQLGDELQRIEAAPGAASPDEQDALAAFRSTLTKIGHADAALTRLCRAMDERTELAGTAEKLDLAPFAQVPTVGLKVVAAQLNLTAPAFRYAIRLSCALTVGMGLTLALPGVVHGGWVLLTAALIMRANYGVTRRRRHARLIGTLVGCVLATALINLAPAPLLLAVIVISIGLSHAYAAIDYRITSLFASVTALLLLHVLAPGAHPLLLERVVDTLVGAGLSYGFSFLLPSWERDDLPRTLETMIEMDSAFAAQALTRDNEDHAYRLARKRALDAAAGLAGAVRRLADEPRADRGAIKTLNDLLGANYLLASDLASVQVLLKARQDQLDPAHADRLLAEVRAPLIEALRAEGDGAEKAAALRRQGLGGLETGEAMAALARRLVHAGHSARKVANLAAAITGRT